jgi:hypothetical protein
MIQTNQTNDLKQLLLANILGLSGIGTYSVMPIGILGSMFNLASLIIFFKKDFRKVALFKYLQVYSLASILVTTTVSLGFLFFDLTNFFNIAIS